jgi:hypothetical protein
VRIPLVLWGPARGSALGPLRRCALGRALAVLVMACVLAGPGAAALGAPHEKVVPLEQYTTPKGKGLATTYRAELLQLSTYIYFCMPWVDVQKNGIGFRTPKGVLQDDRYLSVWIWIEQQADAEFAASTPAKRASAMFSRYGPALLRQMTSRGAVASDANVDGFGVVLSWLKPGTTGRGQTPVNETLVFFSDRTSTLAFLAKRLSAPELLSGARHTVFDGERELGRLTIDVWDDPFVGTYWPKNYELPKEQKCPGAPATG